MRVKSLMGFYTPGQTVCALCKCVVNVDEATVVFPHFLGPAHDLYFLSDGVCHSKCFEVFPRNLEFIYLLDLFHYVSSEERMRNVNNDFGWIPCNFPEISNILKIDSDPFWFR